MARNLAEPVDHFKLGRGVARVSAPRRSESERSSGRIGPHQARAV